MQEVLALERGVDIGARVSRCLGVQPDAAAMLVVEPGGPGRSAYKVGLAGPTGEACRCRSQHWLSLVTVN